MTPKYCLPDIALAFGAGLMLGVLSWSLTQDWLAGELARLKAACGYDPHPISDVAWELYERGMIPVGTAWYYTGLVRSRNQDAADCMRARLS